MEQHAGDHAADDEPSRRHLRGVRRFSMSFPVEEFVDAVGQHRFLFDCNEPEFKDVAKKKAVWEAIGQQFGISGCKAKNKWRNMRDQYIRARKQEMMERCHDTPRFRKPVKTWAFYDMMRQVLKRMHHTPAGAAHGTEGSDIDSGDEEPAVDSEHEDEETMASLERSITQARALFHKRCKEFKDAVELLERELPVTSTLTPAEARPELCLISESVPCFDVQKQTSTPPPQEPKQMSTSDITEPIPSHSPATAEDGLEHFGLFVAERLRMVDSVMQARLVSAILNLVVNMPSAT
ncbi:hypothetical protein V5799_022259 [Amblyomma americanum]|uniref:MADF domain-containing protein n=1 Tax=Amblyomma americanum TaxID=6943 RepID=A0AAQ4FLH7_AMBAM